VLGENKSHSFR